MYCEWAVSAAAGALWVMSRRMSQPTRTRVRIPLVVLAIPMALGWIGFLMLTFQR
jgi:hypothetical protein